MRQRLHNGWFLSEIEYSGEGYAEFFPPQSYIEDDIKIKFSELDAPYLYQDTTEIYYLDYCRNLFLSTSYGEFTARENTNLERHPPFEDYCSFTGSLGWVKYRFLQIQYKTFNNKSVKYWVLPLSNYLSYFHTQYPHDLNDHPLRIDSPKGLTHFGFNGGLGFIEPLVDYEERRLNLLKAEKRSLITAVMVGDVGSYSIELNDLEQWFPFYFLSLLGLATGREVSSPWIEFRDAYGQLLKRIHISLGNPSFQNGHNIIDEEMYRGSTGRLLTQSQKSPHKGLPYINAVLKHLIHGSRYDLPFEDSLNHIIQALDCICEVYNLSTQHLTQDIDPSLVAQVKNILDSAAKQIRGLRCSNSENIKISKIADRVINSNNKDRDFGLALEELLKLFSLPDADIMNSYVEIKNDSNTGKITAWSSYISHIRGTVIHTGYFNLCSRSNDMEDVIDAKAHLTDILIRIILKMLCYDWFYRPPLWDNYRKYPTYMNATVPTDWIDRQGIQARDLGYRQKFNSPNEEPSWRACMTHFVSEWERKKL